MSDPLNNPNNPETVDITPDELANVNLSIPHNYAVEIAAGQRLRLVSQHHELSINQQSYRRTHQGAKADEIGAELTRIQMALALLTKLYGKEIEDIADFAMEQEAAKTVVNRKRRQG